MLDLDKLMNEGIEVKILGKQVTVLQPTIRDSKTIDKLLSEMNEKNAYEKRISITKVILNNNAEGIKFSDEDINKIPVKLQTALHIEINKFVYDLTNSPN